MATRHDFTIALHIDSGGDDLYDVKQNGISYSINRSMTAVDIREEILDILEAIAPDEDLSQIDDAINFRDQLELDSMDFLDIVMELRKRHRIQIPEDDYVQLASMNSTARWTDGSDKGTPKAPIISRVRAVMSEVGGSSKAL